MSLMQNKKFRNEVLRVLVKLYMNLEKPDFINVCQVTIGLSKICYVPDVQNGKKKKNYALVSHEKLDQTSKQFAQSDILIILRYIV